MKTKKLLSILLSVLMLTGVFAVNASAVSTSELSETDIYVAGTLIGEGYYLVEDGGITAENASAENYNVKFTPASGDAAAKLTLNNANLSKTVDLSGDTAAVLSGGNIDVELIGENIISDGFYAVAAFGDINLLGSGSLSYSSDLDTAGIIVSIGNITVGDKVQINISTPELQYVHGLFTEEGTVIIKENAKVNMKITGEGVRTAGLTVSDNAQLTVDSANIGSTAEINGDVTISDKAVVNLTSTREISGYSAEERRNYALYVYGDVSVSDEAQLNATAGSGKESVGIFTRSGSSTAKLSFTVSGNAKINAKSGNATEITRGILVDYAGDESTFTVSGNAQVTAEAGNITGSSDTDSSYESSSSSIGINVKTVVISGSAKLTGIGGDAAGLDESSTWKTSGGITAAHITAKDSAKIEGVAVEGESQSIGTGASTINISGSAEIIGKAGNSASGNSYGIYGNIITASGSSKLTGTAGTAAGGTSFSYGIYTELLSAEGNVTIEAAGSDGDGSFGIYSEEALSISGNTKVTATAKSGKGSGGIGASNIEIKDNAVVIATASDASQGYSAGVYADESMTVEGKVRIEASAAKAAEASVGIFANSSEASITITDGMDIKATGGDSVISCGLVIGNVAFEGGKFEAAGKTAAIYKTANVEISDESNLYVLVNTEETVKGAEEWDGETALCGEENTYKYIYIASEKPEVKTTVSKLPEKTTYNYKDSLDLSGIEITVTGINGDTETVTDTSKMTVSGFDSSKVGEQTVTVEYDGNTAEFTVTVSYSWWQWIIRILLLGFLWY